MKYDWEKGLKKLMRRSPELNSFAAWLSPEIQVVGVVFACPYRGEAAFVKFAKFDAGVTIADMLQDAIGDLDALRVKALRPDKDNAQRVVN